MSTLTFVLYLWVFLFPRCKITTVGRVSKWVLISINQNKQNKAGFFTAVLLRTLTCSCPLRLLEGNVAWNTLNTLFWPRNHLFANHLRDQCCSWNNIGKHIVIVAKSSWITYGLTCFHKSFPFLYCFVLSLFLQLLNQPISCLLCPFPPLLSVDICEH